MSAPQLILWVSVVVLGLAFGSFATMAGYRLPRRESLCQPPSHCPKCDHRLGARDLMPVFSWLLSGGRCRYCRAPISLRYPLIELATAGLFASIYALYGISPLTLLYCGLAVCLVVMIVSDLETYLLPDAMQVAAALLGLLHLFAGPLAWQDGLIGATIGLGVGAGIHYGYFFLKGRHGLGLGDVKLLGVTGLWLGPYALIPFLFYSGIVGVVFGIVWQLVTGARKFPFGPALAITLLILRLWPDAGSLFWDTIQSAMSTAANSHSLKTK